MEEIAQKLLYEHEALFNKLDNLQSLGKVYIEYLEDTAKNELNYSKKLYMQSINGMKYNKGEMITELMEETMKIAFNELSKEAQMESDVHKLTSERLNIIKIEFETFMKSYETEKKRCVQQITSKLQEFQSMLKNVEKQKLNYMKNEEDLNEVTKELNISYENNPTNLTKLVQKKEHLIEKKQNLQQLYKDTVLNCNDFKHYLYTEIIPGLIQSIVMLISQFYKKIHQVLSKIMIGFEELSPVVAKEANLLRIFVMEMNFESDLKELTTKYYGKTSPIDNIICEIDETIEYITPIDQLQTKKKEKKEKRKDSHSPRNRIFNESIPEVENVHEMMKQQEEYIESPRNTEESYMNQEIIEGELIDLS